MSLQVPGHRPLAKKRKSDDSLSASAATFTDSSAPTLGQVISPQGTVSKPDFGTFSNLRRPSSTPQLRNNGSTPSQSGSEQPPAAGLSFGQAATVNQPSHPRMFAQQYYTSKLRTLMGPYVGTKTWGVDWLTADQTLFDVLLSTKTRSSTGTELFQKLSTLQGITLPPTVRTPCSFTWHVIIYSTHGWSQYTLGIRESVIITFGSCG